MTQTHGTSQRSLIFADDFSSKEMLSLFKSAKSIKNSYQNSGKFPDTFAGAQVGLLFAEASTRTRLSFQMAAQRMGAQTLLVEAGPSSSLSKGETVADTVRTLAANRPDLIVVRCGENGNLAALPEGIDCPLVNGGFGHKAHPTQAFLDIFTLLENDFSLTNSRILFVGDLVHSRVFSSHLRVAKSLGIQVGVCAPKAFLPKDVSEFTVFESLDEALEWTQVYCGLRIQFERHAETLKMSTEDFCRDYSLDKKRLAKMSPEIRILHPGPVNWGVEFQAEVGSDPRLLMWEQNANGVYVRAALLHFLRNGEWA